VTTPQEDLAAKMRDFAVTMRELNRLYDYNIDYGWWNPLQLEKEAAIVETADEL